VVFVAMLTGFAIRCACLRNRSTPASQAKCGMMAGAAWDQARRRPERRCRVGAEWALAGNSTCFANTAPPLSKIPGASLRNSLSPFGELWRAGRLCNSMCRGDFAMTKPKPAMRSQTVRFEPEEYEAIEALAAAERRPVANLIRLLVADAVAGRSSRGASVAA
jgi:hypothetical protein